MDPQTAVAGENYLNSLNFRSLIEWMTAEALLSRPEDPIVFLHSLLDEKLAERPANTEYNAEQATTLLKQCYAAASSSADENGRITVKPRKFAPKGSKKQGGNPPSSDSALVKRLTVLEKAIYACRIIAMQLQPDEITPIIIKQACVVLNAERATLFIHDPNSDMLVLSVSEGATDIRVPIGKGVAGTVAATGRPVNIVDAYANPDFDSHYDQQTGYKTKSILCVPIRNGQNKIVGVMQVLNKLGVDQEAGFTELDEEITGILSAQAGVAIHNAKTHYLALQARERVKEVLGIVRDMHGDLGFSSLMFTISTRVQRLINSDRCTLYIIDRAENELWTLQGEVNIRVPMNQGIAGAAAVSNEAINLADAYEDPRFNKEFDQKNDYHTRSVLAMPLRNSSGTAIAVMQLINKRGDGPSAFSDEDEELLGTFLHIAGPILATSHNHPNFASGATSKSVKGAQFANGVARPPQEVKEMKIICEDEEDEG